MQVAMNDVVGAVLAQNAFEISRIPPGARDSLHTGPPDDVAAEGADLLAFGALIAELDEEIHVEAPPIDVTQDLEEPGFHAAEVHRSEHVQDPDRSAVIANHAALFLHCRRKVAQRCRAAWTRHAWMTIAIAP